MKKAIITIFTLIIMFAAASYDSYAFEYPYSYTDVNKLVTINDVDTFNYSQILEMSDYFIDYFVPWYDNSLLSNYYDINVIYQNPDNTSITSIELVFYENQKTTEWKLRYNQPTFNAIEISNSYPVYNIKWILNTNNLWNVQIYRDVNEKNFTTLSMYYHSTYGDQQTQWKFTSDVYNNTNTKIYSLKSSDLVLGYISHLLTFPPTSITNPNEYLYITLPREGYQTIDKFMTYNVMYSIAADQVSDVTISPKDITGDSFSTNTNIKSFDVVNHTATIENGYLKGTLQLLVDYNSTFIGPIGTQIKVTNTVTNRELSITRNAEIVAFVDADGDGIDDNTGQDQFNRIEVPTLDDLTLTDAIDTLTGVIPSIVTWIGSVVSIIAVIFGWLPAPITALMIMIMIFIGVTTLIKVLRG